MVDIVFRMYNLQTIYISETIRIQYFKKDKSHGYYYSIEGYLQQRKGNC